MEYEIKDNPEVDYDEQGEVIEHHSALKNQSSVQADKYPAKKRKEFSALVIPEEESA
jgi:glutamine amidotransferase PdxT